MKVKDIALPHLFPDFKLIGGAGGMEAEVKRNVVLRGQQVVLMADHSKFDHAAFITFCSLEQLSCVVTDRMPSQPYLDVLAANHIRLLCPDNPD